MTTINTNTPHLNKVSTPAFQKKQNVGEGYDELAFLAKEPNNQPAWAAEHHKKKSHPIRKLFTTLIVAGGILLGFKRVKVTESTPKLVKQLNSLANSVFGRFSKASAAKIAVNKTIPVSKAGTTKITRS